MRIVNDYPPNIDAIREVFPLKGGEVFAWNDTIYNPAGKPIPDHILMHEATHFAQQKEAGGADLWWVRYLTDPRWRYEQELEAHQVEYKAYCAGGATRNERRAYLKAIARRLSSPMYGSVVSFATAQRAIKKP